ADMTAVGSLPVTDPTGGRRELMATAEAKALGLRSSGGTDGFVGFDATARWTFDPNNRAMSGAFDFLGVAEHEFSEVLGRSADLVALDVIGYDLVSGGGALGTSPGGTTLGSASSTQLEPVPEPASLGLLAAALFALALLRPRRRRTIAS